MRLVVGLRNPGNDYEGTRHNLGYEVVDRLVARSGESWSRAPSRLRAMSVVTGVGPARIVYLAPNTFMNESGGSVRSALDYYKLTAESMLLVHDDIDLAFGRLRLQVGGGSGGHNGIRSVERALGTNEFSRLKAGVGRPPGSQDPAEFVLRGFSKAERSEIDFLVDDAADVIEAWVADPERAQEHAAHRVNRSDDGTGPTRPLGEDGDV